MPAASSRWMISLEQFWPARRFLARVAMLLTVTAAAFAPALHGPQVFDDRSTIENNPTITQLWPPGVPLHPPFDRPVAGRPVSNYSLAINYAINRALGVDQRPDPNGPAKTVSYHALTLLLHLLSGLLLLGVVRRTLRSGRFGEAWTRRADPIALVVAALWMLHPIQTAAVDYLSQRTEVLVSFCLLATLYSSLRAWDAATIRRRRQWYVLGVIACLLGMGSKETMVGAPLLVVLYDRAFRFRSWTEWRTPEYRDRRWFYGCLFATLVLLASLVAGGPRSKSAGFNAGMQWYDYLNSQGWAIPHYLRLVAWPDALNFDYGRYPIPAWHGLPGLLFLGLLAVGTVVAWVHANRWGWLAFCGTWFFTLLAPTSSVVPLLGEIAADRRIYLALAGVIVPAAIGVVVLASRWSPMRRAPMIAPAVIALLGILTFERSQLYGSAEAIWRDATRKAPANSRAWNNLGAALVDQPDRRGEADALFRRAADLDSTDLSSAYNLALSDVRLRRYDEAERLLRQVLAVMPFDGSTMYQLSEVLLARGDAAGAIPLLDRLAAALPDGPAPFKLGLAYLQAGRPEDAAATFRHILELQPTRVEVMRVLGAVLNDQEHPDQAIPYLEHAVALEPQSDASLALLSFAYAKAGRAADAVQMAQRAAQLGGRNAEVYRLAGNSMLAIKRYDLAEEYLIRSTGLDSGNAEGHAALGAVQTHLGKKDEAMKEFRRALVIDSNNVVARDGLSRRGTRP